jgi:hypothetical protein
MRVSVASLLDFLSFDDEAVMPRDAVVSLPELETDSRWKARAGVIRTNLVVSILLGAYVRCQLFGARGRKQEKVISNCK